MAVEQSIRGDVAGEVPPTPAEVGAEYALTTEPRGNRGCAGRDDVLLVAVDDVGASKCTEDLPRERVRPLAPHVTRRTDHLHGEWALRGHRGRVAKRDQ